MNNETKEKSFAVDLNALERDAELGRVANRVHVSIQMLRLKQNIMESMEALKALEAEYNELC